MKFLAILLLAAAPCRAAAKNPDTLVYLTNGDIESLDPAWIYDGLSQEIQYQLYETLVMFKGSSTEEFIGLAAESYRVSKDGLTYTFPIRKGVKFHDGSPMTPEDARYSFMRFLLMDRSSGPAPLLLEPILGVENAEAPDAFSRADQALRVEGNDFIIKLKKPCAPLLSILATYSPVVSKAYVAAHGGWDGAEATWRKHHNPTLKETGLFEGEDGTGPFVLERWDRQTGQVFLKRNDSYWRKPAALKRVVFKTVPEQSARKLMLEAGDADAAMIERGYLPQVSGIKGVEVIDGLPFLEATNCFIMGFKVNPVANPFIGSGKLDGAGIPPDFFSDKDIRLGMANAFDYDAYIKDGYRGAGKRARGPIPSGLFGYNPKQALWPHDLKKAEEHFRKAWGGKAWEKGFTFTLTYQEGRPDRLLACQIMKKVVESLNPKFRVDVRGILWSTLLDDLSANKAPMVNARWGLDFPDPHNAVHPFLHSEGNYSKVQAYRNPEADRLIEEAWRATDKDRRRALYAKLQAIAHDDLPTIFTLDTYNFQVRRAEVKGWEYNPIMMFGYLYPVYKTQ